MSIHTEHPGRYNTCTEQACVAHRARYQKRWHYEASQGKRRTTDATRATRHVQLLLGASWSARAIAGAAETSPSVITRLRDRRQLAIRCDTEARILAIDPSAVPAKASKQTTEPFVSRVGTTRRLQALLYMGWGYAQMRDHSGIPNPAALVHQQGRWVTRSTHDIVARMYDELAMRPGPSRKAATWARKLGYAPPLAWDDIDNDPAPLLDAEPSDELLDEIAVLRRVEGDRTVQLARAERLEVVRRLHARGLLDTEIQRISGIHADQVVRDRRALGLPSNYEVAS